MFGSLDVKHFGSANSFSNAHSSELSATPFWLERQIVSVGMPKFPSATARVFEAQTLSNANRTVFLLRNAMHDDQPGKMFIQ